MVVDQKRLEVAGSNQQETTSLLAAIYENSGWVHPGLGSSANWPSSLFSALQVMLLCPAPMCLVWGEENFVFWNPACLSITILCPFLVHQGFSLSAEHPAYYSLVKPHFAKAKQGQTLNFGSLDLPFITGRKSALPLACSIAPLSGDDHRLEGLLIAEKHAEINCDELPVIKGIPLQIHQLFCNVLSNALKFSTATPLIEIEYGGIITYSNEGDRGNRPGQFHHIIFGDNGIGFEQKFTEKIFHIFQRLSNRQVSGTGIGLALCKKIIENHRGFITANSEPGKGASFHIYLPVC